MNYLFHLLPKILFFPVYVAGWCGFAVCAAAAGEKLYRSGGRNRKCILLLFFLLAVLMMGFFPIRSARYIFFLAFPFTFFAAVFLLLAADCFGKKSTIILAGLILLMTGFNTLKVLHTHPDADFAENAARKLHTALSNLSNNDVLLLGNSREIGRIAHKSGYVCQRYEYRIADAEDLMLLKEHFCDRYKTLILISPGNEVNNPLLPPPFLEVQKRAKTIRFHRLPLQASAAAELMSEKSENIFHNADLTKKMDNAAIERIKTYFKDNSEVLKIVNQVDFAWPYAWPFDHAGSYFPRHNFKLCLEKTPSGENALHLQSDSELPFFHALPFPMDENYLLSLKIQFISDSVFEVKQYLKTAKSKPIFETIKVIAGKSGEAQVFQIPVYPGKLQRLSKAERSMGSLSLFFSLKHGEIRISSFKLTVLKDNYLCRNH